MVLFPSYRFIPIGLIFVLCVIAVSFFVTHVANAQMLTGYQKPEYKNVMYQDRQLPQDTIVPPLPKPERDLDHNVYKQKESAISYDTVSAPQNQSRANSATLQQRPQSQLETLAKPQKTMRLMTGYDDVPIVHNIPKFKNDTIRAHNPVELQNKDQTLNQTGEQAPVDFQADQLNYDEQNRVVTATGRVMMVQAGRILRADKVTYDLNADRVLASGHVVLNEESGDIYYADQVELKDKLKDGFLDGIKGYLNDGSRLVAEKGRRIEGKRSTLYKALYTPCEPCKSNPERAPVWQIKASEVTHDEQDNLIKYKNARFEAFGVPVAYTPYFAHADGSIKRKSGFLSPTAGFKSELGLFVDNSYYWNAAQDKDATFGLLAMTEQAPLAYGEFRHRWDDAGVVLQGGITQSNRPDFPDDDEIRGHILSEARWDMNDKWRSGVDIQWASDDQYMRQYDFIDEDVLESQVYAERFSGRNYAAGRILTFQDTRIREDQADQPEVLPEIMASFVGDAGAVPIVGGRWDADASFLGLRRNGDEQDMNRLSVKGGWERRFISDYGLVARVDADIRGDLYNVRDRVAAIPGSGQQNSTTETRFFPRLTAQTSYPMVKMINSGQITVEPIAAITVTPNIDVSNDIPNEDSQDVQIDASNLFEPNRFPGLDRVEDKTHVTYGLRTGFYNLDGWQADAFLGQSYRLDDDTSPFPEGSGLDDQDSDVVGQLGASFEDYYLNYRFQLDNRSLSSQRHEVDAQIKWDRFSLSNRYLYAKALEGTDINDSREQYRFDAGYYLTPEWRARFGATQDLGEDSGLRQAYAGFEHFGQCIYLSLLGQRNYTDDLSGESDTEILFRIGLKNLGEYQASGLRPDTRVQ